MADDKLQVGTTNKYLHTRTHTLENGDLVHDEVIDHGNFISKLNSRTKITLAAGATWQGEAEEVWRFGRAGVAIRTDNATDGTLTIETSEDGVRFGGPPRSVADSRSTQPKMWEIVEPWLKLKYVNGTTEAINFTVTTQYSNDGAIFLAHQLDEILKDETAAQVVRSVGVGRNPENDYVNAREPGTAFLTTANVAASSTFSSEVLNLSGYSQVQTEIASDKDGTITITFYSDSAGTNAIRNLSIPYVAADGYQLFGAPVFINYVKYQFTNTEGSDTTSFYFSTKFTTSAISPQLIRTDGYVVPQMISSLTRSVNHFDLDAARKHIVGQRSFFFFGHNDEVGTTYEDIWPGGGDINWQQSAAKIKVASSDAADTSGGLGVRSVEIHGLSATGADQDEVIVMNGTTAVESSLTYIRVNKLHNETVGTYGGSHQGDIECRVTNATFSNGELLAVMIGEEGAVNSSAQYGLGEASNGFWTVPLSKVIYLTEVEVNVQSSGNNKADVILYERESILNTSAPMDPRRIIWNRSDIQGDHLSPFKSHIKIKALTDLFFRAKSSNSTLKIDVKCNFYLVDADPSGA